MIIKYQTTQIVEYFTNNFKTKKHEKQVQCAILDWILDQKKISFVVRTLLEQLSLNNVCWITVLQFPDFGNYTKAVLTILSFLFFRKNTKGSLLPQLTLRKFTKKMFRILWEGHLLQSGYSLGKGLLKMNPESHLKR